MLVNASGFGEVERMQPRNQLTLFGTRASSSATRWPQFGLPAPFPQLSVHDPRCDRFTTMTRLHTNTSRRDLGERLPHEGDFSYEDIAGQDEPVDSPPAPRENTATEPQDPAVKDKWIWTLKREDE